MRCVLLFLLAACAQGPEVDADPQSDAARTALPDDWDNGTGPSSSYVGPAYEPCVTEAECDPGSACTTLSGFTGHYCAPACDPAGTGFECQVEGLDFDTTCQANGRCARTCAEDHVATNTDEGPDRSPADDCPEGLECQQTDEAEFHCSGEPSGQAGFYGICGHPNVDGTDCPAESTCFGGSYIGIEDLGICLPWCDDNTCEPPPEGTSGATPYCYEAGLDHPVCLLLCAPGGDSICPQGQECLDLGYGGLGLCAPDGTELPY